MALRLAHIGKDLQSRLKSFLDAPLGPDATPLEICLAVLDDIEGKVEPVGRGRRVFPYSRVTVRIKQTHADRAALEAAFSSLERKVRERLAELRCDAPTNLDARVIVLRKAPADWPAEQVFSVDYGSTHEAPVNGSSSTPTLHITIIKGAAARKSYSFTEPIISIGRTADPTDDGGRVRRNRIVFLDTTDGITETVGRAHAHMRFDAHARAYRLFDDGSSNGTAIVRNGESISVPSRDPRGVRVCSGDEIVVGRAVMRIELG